MRNTVIRLLLFALILLPLLPAQPVFAVEYPVLNTSVETSSYEAFTASKGGVDPRQPAINLALANYTSNHIENDGFESWSNVYTPEDWSSSASGDTSAWFAHSPQPVYEGIFSAGIQCQTPHYQATAAYFYQPGLTVDMFDLNVTFQYYIDKNEYPATDSFHFLLSLQNSTNSWYMYYYLNGTTSSTNSSTFAYFLLNEPGQQWNRFSRNITDDFLSVQEFPGTIDSTLKLKQLQFFGYVSEGAVDHHLRAFVDDVNVVNETNAYIWVGGATKDGNFESGVKNTWLFSPTYDAGSVYQSSDVHTGSWSLNITAAALGNNSGANAHNEPLARLTSQNLGILSFWWNLSYQNANGSSFSRVKLVCTTDVSDRDIYYFMGYGGTSVPQGLSNDSLHRLVFRADSFNDTAGWTHFQRDIWNDAASYFSAEEIFVEQIWFEVWAKGVGRVTTTLIDDVSLVSQTINDGDYEDQQGVDSNIRGWDTEHSYFTVTDSYFVSGNKAANLTVPAGENWNITQPLHGR
ncbi:MAG: hypothetical protein ACFFCO_09415, partial [Promethearchaeota archaeon]